MNHARHLASAVWGFMCFIITDSAAQTTSENNSPVKDIFVGSTPCDPLIKTTLKIPADATCDFIKWELIFDRVENQSKKFQLTALYGESQPNTNGFYGGGTKIELTGNYNITHGIPVNPSAKIYQLNCSKLQSSILLIEMDQNIFHFADMQKNFLLGNAGFGYVLNRTTN